MEYPAEQGEGTIRVLAMDPGTDTMGFAIVDIDINTFEPKVMFGYTHKAAKYAKQFEHEIEMTSFRDVRLRIHREFIQQLIRDLQPDLVAAESPFLNKRQPQAYEALVECFAMIRQAVYYENPTIFVRRIDPITAKAYLGVDHRLPDQKILVENAVKREYRDKCAEGVDIDSFDEHTYDAISIANALLQKHLLKVLLATSKSKTKKKRRKRGKKK